MTLQYFYPTNQPSSFFGIYSGWNRWLYLWEITGTSNRILPQQKLNVLCEPSSRDTCMHAGIYKAWYCYAYLGSGSTIYFFRVYCIYIYVPVSNNCYIPASLLCESFQLKMSYPLTELDSMHALSKAGVWVVSTKVHIPITNNNIHCARHHILQVERPLLGR